MTANSSSRSRARLALDMRKVLRHPATVLISAAGMYFCMCLVGSKTLWYGYYLWQTPSLFAGVLGGSTVLGLVGYATFLATNAVRNKYYWENLRVAVFRHGRATQVTVIVSALCLGIYIGVPSPPPPFPRLFAALESGPSTYPSLKAERDRLHSLPVFSTDPSLTLIENVIEFRSKQWEPDDNRMWANVFAKYENDPDPLRRGWALIMAGDAFSGLKAMQAAGNLYERAANDDKLRPFVRRKALQELGDDAYFRSDLDSAFNDWQASAKIEETVDIDENLAILYGDRKDWKKALDTMNRCKLLLEREESQSGTTIGLNDLKTKNAVQAANLLRRYAQTLSPSEASKQWDLAKDELSRAHDLDPGFLDQYWVGALLSLDEKDRAGLAKVAGMFDLASGDQKLEKDRYQYGKVAVPYMLWLEMRGSLIDSSKIDRGLLNRLDHLGLEGSSRPQKLYRILKNMEDSGVTVDEDVEVLFQRIDALK
jgi:tetratricopeptide (TPR) repeat protein